MAFPDLDGADGGRLAAWAELSPADVPPTLLASEAGNPRPRPVVSAVGYFDGVMGTGEHGRQLAERASGGGHQSHVDNVASGGCTTGPRS